MKRRTIFLKIIILLILWIGLSAHQEKLPVLKGPYFGQKPPGMEPKVFAPTILATGKHAFCSVFSPCGTEFYFVTDLENNDTADLMRMHRVADVWTKPEAAPFNSPYTDNDICMSPDGYRVFWRSWRPLPGHEKPEERSYIWYSVRTQKGWSKAQPIKCEGDFLPAGYPSITYNGTLYFPYRSDVNVGESDIHLSKFIKGAFSTPANLGSTINTKYIEGDMCVAPDESFLVVSCWNRPDNNGESDLYISFRDRNRKWSALKNMGKPINNAHNENCPMISPDGKYFFFFRYDPKNEKSATFWVDIKIIEAHKPKDIE
jgi:hypothetical protein